MTAHDPDELNVFEWRARAMKAEQLSHVCLGMLDHGATIDSLWNAPVSIRRRIARVAQVRTPSDETWELTIEMLRQKATRR